MGSTQTWSEYNGAGAVETGSRAEANWKAIDDSTTAYNSSPINATTNSNSMAKIQAIKFAGTWSSLSSLTYKVDNNAPATGLSIVGAVISSYTQPATTATGDSAASTTGAAANFAGSTTPFAAGASTASGGGTMYGQGWRTQLQTLNTYAGGPGDISSRTITASWTES